MNILFLNHKIQSCGVYQYGLRLFNILNKSDTNKYIYKEIDCLNEYIAIINSINPSVIIYNYHVSTMPWLNNTTIYKNIKSVGIPHESNGSFFDTILSIDPDEKETSNLFNIPRPIYENVQELINNCQILDEEIKTFIQYNEGPDIPIFGSFGFGFNNKGFDKIISLVNAQYDKAIIKLIITGAFFDSNRLSNITNVSKSCLSLNTKPGVKVLITHKFFSNEEILWFLNSNDCNIFMYDKMVGRGISSTIDYAISVNKPVIISDSYMFRNIYSDDICVYKTDIRTAISNSKKLLPNLIQKYSNNNLINKINLIVNNMTKEDKITQLNTNTNTSINKSFNIFNTKITAYYYTENFIESTNVSSYLDKLFCNFIENGETIFEVSNNLFVDTFPNKHKTLFINVHNINGHQTFAYSERSKVNWTDIVRYIHKISKTVPDSSNLIQVSVGEIIDKYSILELKKKYITDPNKINEIQKEMDILDKKVPKNSEFYKQLVYINEQIWLDTDKIKKIKYDPDIDNNIFAKLSNDIFENNQKRFRLKNYFNILEKSDIKECKSYNNNNCFIKIIKEDEIFTKIPEINYLCISYDVIYFEQRYKDIICKIFKNPNISFIKNNNNNNISSTYILSEYSIDKELQNIFELNTITYKSCGRFGDFLNQLSVVCEKFYETGRRGTLLIADLDNKDDKFVFGLENTLNDTYPVISSQIFIKDYKIYNGQPIDIDLSTWRNNVWDLVNKGGNWYNIFSSTYNVSWNKHQCLTCGNNETYNKKWNDKIIIHIAPYRFMSTEAINKLKEKIKDNLKNCIFMSNEKSHYDYFVQQTGINIEHYKPTDFQEVVNIINSCKVGFFGFTSSAVVACMLHKKYYIMGTSNTGEMTLNDVRNVCPFVVGVLS